MLAIRNANTSLAGFGNHIRQIENTHTGEVICHYNEHGQVYCGRAVSLRDLKEALRIIENEQQPTYHRTA
jgi:hypothetical protein